jgi:hypothetical protein
MGRNQAAYFTPDISPVCYSYPGGELLVCDGVARLFGMFDALHICGVIRRVAFGVRCNVRTFYILFTNRQVLLAVLLCPHEIHVPVRQCTYTAVFVLHGHEQE